jgi:hypothetical protein
MTEDTQPAIRSSALERVFGGNPVSVLIRLGIMSLFVGFVMSIFGFNAVDLVNAVIDMVEEAFRDGAGVFRQIWAYILTGAAVVVPIWLFMRLTRGR